MSTSRNIEALALIELAGMPAAARAQDAALKRAPVNVLACAPVSPGKALLIFWGDVASAEESLKAADEAAAAQRIDRVLIPAVHAAVVAAIVGGRQRPAIPSAGCLAIIELTTATAAIEAADAAVKCADVSIGRMHLATGYGGKAFFTLFGAQGDVEAACEAASACAGARLATLEVIPAPHDELPEGLFVRPWPIDPADSG